MKRTSQAVPGQVFVWLITAVFFLYFSFLSISRHTNFHSLRLDLGNMYQTVWNVAHGNGFVLTDPYGAGEISRLTVHADYLLILLAPFVSLWPDVRMLLLIQAAVLALGAIAVYYIGVTRLGTHAYALLFAGLYLLYPPLQRVVLHDFHAVSLSTTLLLFSWLFLLRRKFVWFSVFAFLAALGKEQVWLIAAILSGYAALRYTQFRKPASVLALGFSGIFYYIFWHVIPAHSGSSPHFALGYFSGFGTDPGSIVGGIFTRPWDAIRLMIRGDRLYYLYQLMLPVSFLSFFAPLFLVFSVPTLFLTLLSTNPHMRIIDYQYTSTITPFVFVSAVEGFRRLSGVTDKKQRIVVVCVFALLGSYLWGELPYGRESRFRIFTRPPEEKAVMQRTL